MKKAKYVAKLKSNPVKTTAKLVALTEMQRLLARIDRMEKRLQRLEAKGYEE